MIQNPSFYTRTDTMRDIIRENRQLLTVLNRFDISLGFGDGTVEKVCGDNNVDTDTFLAVTNYISGKRWDHYQVSLRSLMSYLQLSHKRFLEFTLPGIKKMLIEGINEANTSEVAMVILQFYDNYMADVREHMGYEDAVIFTYVENLLQGTISEKFQISEFSSSHKGTASKLDDLKELFIYKYKQKNNEKISTALLQLMICGEELTQHCDIENLMLFPAVMKLEQELRKQQSLQETSAALESTGNDVLTSREKEVLRWLSHGLSTKEIADKMCLSVHTVNTYRKNIGSKLDIHSVTGLAFYAVLHHIIDINEIDIP